MRRRSIIRRTVVSPLLRPPNAPPARYRTTTEPWRRAVDAALIRPLIPTAAAARGSHAPPRVGAVMAHVFVVAPHSTPQYTHCDADDADGDADTESAERARSATAAAADRGSGGGGDRGRDRGGGGDQELLIALHIPLTAPSRAHGGTQLRDENSRVLAEAWGARGAGYFFFPSTRVRRVRGGVWRLLVIVQRRSPQSMRAPVTRRRSAAISSVYLCAASSREVRLQCDAVARRQREHDGNPSIRARHTVMMECWLLTTTRLVGWAGGSGVRYITTKNRIAFLLPGTSGTTRATCSSGASTTTSLVRATHGRARSRRRPRRPLAAGGRAASRRAPRPLEVGPSCGDATTRKDHGTITEGSSKDHGRIISLSRQHD